MPSPAEPAKSAGPRRSAGSKSPRTPRLGKASGTTPKLATGSNAPKMPQVGKPPASGLRRPRRFLPATESGDSHGLAIGFACILIVIALFAVMNRPGTKRATAKPDVVAQVPTPVTVEPDFNYPAEPDAPEPVQVAEAPATAPVMEEEPDIPPPTEEVDPRVAVFKSPLHLLVPMALQKQNQDNFKLAIRVAIESGKWQDYRAYLRRGFDDAVKRVALRTGADRFNALRAEPLFMRAMDMQQFIDTVDPSFLENVAKNSPSHEFYMWLLGGNPDALPEFLQAVNGNINVPEVLKTWASLWTEESKPALRDKYRALQLACAMVFPGDDYNSADSRASNRYRLFRDNAEKGRLTGKIHRMKAEDLIWVVDVPVPDSEIEWALDKMTLSQKNWGQAYGMIEYLMERAVEGLNPYEEYTFAEILKHGGICMDQAYFSANTAKCHGIPAAVVGGDGDRGAHAWIVYMPDEDTWAESGNIGYTTGTTKHPASGETIHQSLLNLTTDRDTRGERLEKTRVFLRFMHLFLTLEQRAIAEEALETALRNTPEHPMPWKEAVALREKDGEKTTLKQWEDLADTIRRRFKDRPDFIEMAESIEDDHIFPSRDAGDNARDVARERRRLARNNEGRTDLVTASIQRQANLLAGAKDFDGISSLYRRAFQDYGDKADAFRKIADQYFGYAAADTKWKEKACREIEMAYKRHIETDTDEYFKASAELTVVRQIAGFYDQAGDAKKAKSLRDRADHREKMTKRSAL